MFARCGGSDFNSRAWEAEAGGFCEVQANLVYKVSSGQLEELHREILPQPLPLNPNKSD